MRQTRPVVIRIGEEPGRATPNLELYRGLPRGPGEFCFVWGWTSLAGRVHPTKIHIQQMTLDILRTHETRMQRGLNKRYIDEGRPNREEFTNYMAQEMAEKIVTRLQRDFPEVGAKTLIGRATVAFAAWLVLRTPAIRAFLNFDRLITLQTIFAFRNGQFVLYISADHGDEPPRMRN